MFSVDLVSSLHQVHTLFFDRFVYEIECGVMNVKYTRTIEHVSKYLRRCFPNIPYNVRACLQEDHRTSPKYQSALFYGVHYHEAILNKYHASNI